MVKPITPEEVVSKKEEILPDFVFESFNYLIAQNWKGGSSSFKQDDVVNLIREKMSGDFDIRWLDVEPVYRRAGWKVEYDKPGYCESYSATFTFRK